MKDVMNNLRSLVEHYGKRVVNSATKYPSILTYHDIDGNTGTLLPELTVDLGHDNLFATEKIDGCNGRVIFYKGKYLVGSREDILCYSGDLYHNPSLDMVDILRRLLSLDDLAKRLSERGSMVVVYGELYGGKTTPASKNYGRDANGFRVFDAFELFDTDIEAVMSMPPEKVSLWRESSNGKGLKYGQPFMSVNALREFCTRHGFEQVPMVPFQLKGTSHQEVMEALRAALPETLVALTPSAMKRPEGLVVRTEGRDRIVKLRFEDYDKTLNPRRRHTPTA